MYAALAVEGFMFKARSNTSRRALVPVVAGIMLWSSLASVVVAADKTFSASVGPSPLVAGATYGEEAREASPLTITITNTSTAQTQLGSANVTAPVGVLFIADTASSSVGTATHVGSSLIELRSLALAPTASVVVTVSAQVECATNPAHPYTWGFVTKQANDFNGTGNELSQDAPVSSTVFGTCGIVFSAQPAHSENSPAENNQAVAITSKIYDPSGPPVEVTVRDGLSVDTVPWWSGTITLTKGNDPSAGDIAVLSGDLSGSASGGSVTFAPEIDLSGSGYTLRATAEPTPGSASVGTSATPVPSAPFDIVDDAGVCVASDPASCFAEAKGPTTKAAVRAATQGSEGDGDLVILSINDPTVAFDCAGYSATSDVIEYNVTKDDGVASTERAKVATFTLDAAAVTKSASKYEVCYSSNKQFLTKSGAPAPLVGTPPAYVGLLPACVKRNPDPQQPCVVSKVLDKQKNLVIVVSSPPGDPAGKF
jgi:hypothetical protein